MVGIINLTIGRDRNMFYLTRDQLLRLGHAALAVHERIMGKARLWNFTDSDTKVLEGKLFTL
jgi:hypothetical protein